MKRRSNEHTKKPTIMMNEKAAKAFGNYLFMYA